MIRLMSSAEPRQLDALLAGFATPTNMDLSLTNMSLDSRQTGPGSAFLAIPGSRVHGAQYIGDASARGASVILLDALYQEDVKEVDQIPVVRVERLAEHASEIAGRLFGEPSKGLWVAGVTGTNGKTSCAWWLQQLLNCSGIPSASLGTLGIAEKNEITTQEGELTTADAVELQRNLASLKKKGLESVVMEASSHGLSQHRVDGIAMDLAILTNLTQDHLDYHGNLDAYAGAKGRLFNLPGLAQSLINIDDTFGRQLVSLSPNSVESFTYSLKDPDADFYVLHGASYPGLVAQLQTPWGEISLSNPDIFGDYNLANLICVAAAAAIKGVDADTISEAVQRLTPVPGRLQRVSSQIHDIDVVVDFAHTPDAVTKTLSALKTATRGSLRVLLGAGGDRDLQKRPLMTQAALDHADFLVITNDNPRSESPEAIAQDLMLGVRDKGHAKVSLDRGEAIADAIAQAKPGDCIAILGKGHEEYQIFGERKLPFSDVKVAREALARRSMEGLQ